MRPALHPIAVAAVLGSALFTTAAHAAEYGTVISSTPVTASVAVPRQECSEGQALVQTPPSGAGALLGAIAGGVLGHNLGDGFGRAAATGIGVVAGSVIGNQVEANANPATAVPVRRCQTVSRYENRVVGYDVVYDYAGQRYTTRMAQEPGRRIAISVQPLDERATGQPVPTYTGPADQGVSPQTVYYAPVPPRTVYYAPVPPQTVYYAPAPAVSVWPRIGLDFGFGYRGGYGGWGADRGGDWGHGGDWGRGGEGDRGGGDRD